MKNDLQSVQGEVSHDRLPFLSFRYTSISNADGH